MLLTYFKNISFFKREVVFFLKDSVYFTEVVLLKGMIRHVFINNSEGYNPTSICSPDQQITVSHLELCISAHCPPSKNVCAGMVGILHD